MNVMPTTISDVLVLEPDVFSDDRGFFMETWNRRTFADSGIDFRFVQDNHSRSVAGALRGLHYQIRHPQGKLVRVTTGEIFDVAVDIRKSSPTFGQWVSTWLSGADGRMLWIPPGFCHGFYVTAGPADVLYKCTDYYSATDERCIRWNDPQLAIQWPLSGQPLLSDKDQFESRPLAEAECFS
jgi:dTDP-4-dehydrorhamnose 3,5-epimerase